MDFFEEAAMVEELDLNASFDRKVLSLFLFKHSEAYGSGAPMNSEEERLKFCYFLSKTAQLFRKRHEFGEAGEYFFLKALEYERFLASFRQEADES